MFIVGIPLSVDIPDHAIERAEQRLGLSERQVLEYWDGVIVSGQEWLSNIPVGGTHRIVDGGANWVVRRYSDSGIRVMTVMATEGA